MPDCDSSDQTFSLPATQPPAQGVKAHLDLYKEKASNCFCLYGQDQFDAFFGFYVERRGIGSADEKDVL